MTDRNYVRSALRLAAALVVASALLWTGCDKPKEEDCKKAVENIRSLYETGTDNVGANPSAMIRSCRGSASPESVQCFIAAKSLDDLKNCEGDTFAKLFEGDESGDKKEDKKEEDEDGDGAEKKDDKE